MSYNGSPNYTRAFRVLYGAMWVAFVCGGLYLAFRPSAPPPSSSKAFGCYIAANAPPILLDAKGMMIGQSPPIRIAFHLEASKTGIMLTADAPIIARPGRGGYSYSIESRGIGRFLNFSRDIDGRSYGVFDENELHRFTMLADDGVELFYRKADAVACPGGE